MNSSTRFSLLVLALTWGFNSLYSQGFKDSPSSAGGTQIHSNSTQNSTAQPESTWDPLAGLWPGHNENALVTVSSEDTTAPLSMADDGDQNTGWRSKPALPANFMSRADRNPFYLGNKLSNVSKSNGGSSPKVTDGNVKTGENVQSSSGKRWLKLDFSQTLHIRYLSMKASNANGDIEIWGYLPNGDSVKADTYTTNDHYSIKRITVKKNFTGLKLKSQADFLLFEVAALEELLYEDINLDLKSSREIGWIFTCFRNSQWIDSVHFDVSNDQITWTTVARPDHQYYFELAFEAQPRMNARYARIRIFVTEQDFARAELYEYSIRDRNGIYGPMPAAKPATRPLGEMMGINGIRGWGHGIGSHALDTTQGAYFYNKVASIGRNYQNLSWDTRDPDNTPDYNNMPGTLRFSWLNWDDEYDTWNNADMDVQVTLQFLNSSQPQNTWNNPWQAAYNIGYAFASHFGPTNGVGNVKALEIGNEPWDYEKNFYRTILNGMAQGAKAADSALLVFSGALQAGDPSEERGTSGNFIGERLTANEAPYLDGINSHHYSYMIDPVARHRISTYPENPLSEFRGVLSDLRFRDHNMPGTEYRLTEWGWGSDGAGQNCGLNECVTERAQAIYGARALFMLDRLGVDKAMWYFYANLPGIYGSVYGRSGLTGPTEDGSIKKLSYYVFETIMQKLGNSHFLSVLQEDEDAWAYVYGDSLGNPAYVVAWKPTEEADPTTSAISLNVGFPVTAAMELDGTPGGKSKSTPTQSGGTVSLNVSATPVVLTLGNSSVLSNPVPVAMPGNLKMEIFPNPNNGQFTLQLQLPENAQATITVLDMGGKIIHRQQENLSMGNAEVAMQLNNLPKGYYLIEASIKSDNSGQEQQLRQKMLIAR